MRYLATETRKGRTDEDTVRLLALQASRLDTAAFGDLYRLYFPQVFRYVASRVAGPQEAEDLTNTVFEKALAAIGRYEPSPALFSTWLHTIVRNVVIDYHRKRRVPVDGEADHDLLTSTDPEGNPEAYVLADERRGLLRQAILELTYDQRQVVGCRFFFNLSVREVAQAMGKSEGAVKALQFRALDRLRRRLAADWSEP